MSERRGRDLRLWLDLVNTPEALFFAPIMRALEEKHQGQITVRDRAETRWLASFLGMDCLTIGGDSDGWLAKRAGLAGRTLLLQRQVRSFDTALSFGNPNSVIVAQWRNRPNIVFEDNDLDWAPRRSLTDEIVRRIVWTSTFKVVPKAFPVQKLVDAGIPRDSIYTFDGYKEQVYLAGFQPNPDFGEKLPATPYVVVRPEALSSSYVGREPSLVPRILKALNDRKINVVYLPRSPADRAMLNGARAFVPDEPLFGPDLVWNAACVLTGSGTMAREAACMGLPAVSFFNGRGGALLSVDRQLVEEGRLIHTRDPDVLLSYVTRALEEEATPDTKGNTQVHQHLMSVVSEIVARIEDEDFPVKRVFN